MSTIQYIDKEHRELLEDLREIARSYQPLRETDPQKYRRTVLREMNDYLHRIKQHPVFSEFCELTHINQDEFMNDIIQQITDEWLVAEGDFPKVFKQFAALFVDILNGTHK